MQTHETNPSESRPSDPRERRVAREERAVAGVALAAIFALEAGVALVLAVALAAAPALAEPPSPGADAAAFEQGGERGTRPPRGHRGPPPEAKAACDGLSRGATCSFDAPHGTMSGSCQSPPHCDLLACVPEGHRGPGRQGPGEDGDRRGPPPADGGEEG